MLLKHYLDRGVSKAELSRRFGVNRRTIHNWVDTGQLDRDLAAGARGYSPRPPVAHKLDPYKAIIDARLEAFPKLSAKRLFDEVRAAGYPGCYSRVNDYVQATRPREPVESLVRFETPAGRQGQVDFGTFTLPWGRRHALVIVLGYSRLLWLHFYTRQTMPVLMEGLESAFDRFGGVPACTEPTKNCLHQRGRPHTLGGSRLDQSGRVDCPQLRRGHCDSALGRDFRA